MRERAGPKAMVDRFASVDFRGGMPFPEKEKRLVFSHVDRENLRGKRTSPLQYTKRDEATHFQYQEVKSIQLPNTHTDCCEWGSE